MAQCSRNPMTGKQNRQSSLIRNPKNPSVFLNGLEDAIADSRLPSPLEYLTPTQLENNDWKFLDRPMAGAWTFSLFQGEITVLIYRYASTEDSSESL